MSGIFNSSIFNNAIFNIGDAASPPVVVDEIKTGTGGIDVFKPTGLIRRKKAKFPKIEERIEEFSEAQHEIAVRLANEFAEVETFTPVSKMSMLDVEREIGTLLRQQVEEEELLLLLMAAAAG